MRLSEVPQSERPRERMQEFGADQLSSAELLAIVLSTGTKGTSVLQLAQEMLARFGSLEELLGATLPELMLVKGIGKAKAIQLKAAFSLAKRALKPSLTEKQPLIHAHQVHALLKDEITNAKKELFYVLLRDVRGLLIHTEKVAIGTLSEVLVHPREVFYPAVRHKAHSLIIAHNHPSGDPTPSKADLDLTRQLLHSSRLMDIPLADHIILTASRFLSLKELGYF